MNRWRANSDHEVLVEAVKDEELVELARAIFGDVIDIDNIIDNVGRRRQIQGHRNSSRSA